MPKILTTFGVSRSAGKTSEECRAVATSGAVWEVEQVQVPCATAGLQTARHRPGLWSGLLAARPPEETRRVTHCWLQPPSARARVVLDI